MIVLIVTKGYFPGQGYGGPPVSVSNFCTLMGQNCNCFIITCNHEARTKAPYESIEPNTWIKRNHTSVIYLPEEDYTSTRFEALIDEVSPDIIYLQSIFQDGVLTCLKIAKQKNIKVLLAPRGELCEGAIKKKYKKYPYLLYLRLSGYLNNTYFQSTSEDETEGIERYLGTIYRDRVFNLDNIPSIPDERIVASPSKKKEGEIRIVYFSRIDKKKNLHYTFDYLRQVRGSVVFDVIGAISDQKYWDYCKSIIKTMPENITITYKGSVSHDEVFNTLSGYDLLLFPTSSENFGHAIVEALLVGCPIIISDQTPWTDINYTKGGYAISLDEESKFVAAIQSFIDKSSFEHDQCKIEAAKYIRDKINLNVIQKKYESALNAICDR